MAASIGVVLPSMLVFFSTFSEALVWPYLPNPNCVNQDDCTTTTIILSQSISGSRTRLVSSGSSSSIATLSSSTTNKPTKSTPHVITSTLTCTAQPNTASLVPSESAKPDRTVCSCDNGEYYSTLSGDTSSCAYTKSDPFILLPPNAGPWTFAPSDLQPSICTASTFPVSTTNIMPTGEFVVEGNWEGSSTWLFSVDMGMSLSSFGYGDYSGSPFRLNANGSYTLSVPANGGGSSVTGLASGTPENETMAYAHEFALTLSTTLTCNKSLPAPCTANDNGLNVSNWEAFSTDSWWTSYVSSYTTLDSPNYLFDQLVFDYIGPIGSQHCSIGNTQLNGDGSMDLGVCNPPDCVSVNDTLSSKDGFRQGYMVLADWEGLSAFLNFCWAVLDQAQNGFDDVITSIYLTFYRDPALKSWQTLLPVIGTAFTLMCVVLLFIQPFWGGALIATAANAIYAIGASMNGIANIKNLDVPSVAVLEWEGSSNTQLAWRNNMGTIKTGLSNLHDDYFTNGWNTAPVNISTILLGGAYLPETTTVNQTHVLPSDNVTAWLESYACAKLINQLFVQNDYYVVYASSVVEDVPGVNSRGNFSFERSDCEEWLYGLNSSVYITCDTLDSIGPGMTLLEGVQDAIADYEAYNYKAAFTVSFGDGNFTYSALDVIQASVSGWLSYGYNYTLINDNYGFSLDALDSVENFREQLFAVADIRSNNSGVYNLPVCVLNSLASIPECTYVWSQTTDGHPIGYDQSSYCYIHPNNCLDDQSGVLPTQNATYGFQYFRDHVADRLKNNLNNFNLAGPFGAPKKRELTDRKSVDVRPAR